jgi:predicted metal-dependent hydrolase
MCIAPNRSDISPADVREVVSRPVDEKFLATFFDMCEQPRPGPLSRYLRSVDTHPVEPLVEVRRSRRRKRTVSAYRDGERIVVMIPARMTRKEEREWVATMIARVQRAEQRRRPDDDALRRRAARLSERYLDGLATPSSVRWVDNQRTRWGSCTPADGTIRLSRRLEGMPTYVLDYVLLHELTHLLVPGHGDEFWDWVGRYELTERARGFLEGVSTATQLPPPPGSEEAMPLLDEV